MLILSWNVNFRRPKDLVSKIEAKEPDIVTLQEVKVEFAKRWAKRLSDSGFNVHLSGQDVWSGKNTPKSWYQCMIASRCDLTSDGIKWREHAPYPELLGRATVSVPDEGKIDVFTAHIPNGEQYGWQKIDTLNVLAAALRGASDSPRILTGDFNEPKMFLSSGRIVTFGENENARKDGGTYTCRWGDPMSASRTPIDWRNGVLAVLGGESQHGLRDAYRDRHGSGTPAPVTHRTRGNPRCFDHTFVSRHYEVLGCGYYHEWRNQLKLSDHSPMWTKLQLRTDLPALTHWAGDCS